MNSLSRQEGLFKFSGIIADHYFPDFKLFNIDLTDRSSGFGAAGRFNLPLDMLYPDKNKNELGKLNQQQQAAVNEANKQINEFYEQNRYVDE